ncbi:hypothetical protein GCM10010440_22270 [Kitasatospora cinereorecta]
MDNLPLWTTAVTHAEDIRTGNDGTRRRRGAPPGSGSPSAAGQLAAGADAVEPAEPVEEVLPVDAEEDEDDDEELTELLDEERLSVR